MLETNAGRVNGTETSSLLEALPASARTRGVSAIAQVVRREAEASDIYYNAPEIKEQIIAILET